MADKIICPRRIKYKGYTITQIEGQVIVTDIHRHIVLTIDTIKPHTYRELCELFDFNAVCTGLIDEKGGDKVERKGISTGD